MSIFIQALNQGIRFQTNQGMMSTEDLFRLPLRALDEIYKALKRQSKNAEEESLLRTVSPESKELTLKIDIVTEVVQIKQAENKAKLEKREKEAKKKILTEALADKQQDKIKEMSEEELQEALKAL